MGRRRRRRKEEKEEVEDQNKKQKQGYKKKKKNEKEEEVEEELNFQNLRKDEIMVKTLSTMLHSISSPSDLKILDKKVDSQLHSFFSQAPFGRGTNPLSATATSLSHLSRTK